MTKTLGDLVAKDLLSELNLPLDSKFLKILVSGITVDSRQVRKNSVFFAIQGGSQDGHDFLREVAQAGASVVFGERPSPQNFGVAYIQVQDAKKILARLAAKFYADPSTKMWVMGITGTSGKTTISYLIESILQAAGHRVGVIGTVNFRFGSTLLPSSHTTPGPVELQNILSQMKKEGCTSVVLEVSSHALKQKRTAAIAFDGMIFSNLSPEHLDFHPDMEDYFLSKAVLFTDLADYSVTRGKSPVGVINTSDPYGHRLAQMISSSKNIRTLEFGPELGLKVTLEGIRGEVQGVLVRSDLTGQFNCFNIAAAVTLAVGLNIPAKVIAVGIQNLKGVPGRLERVKNECGIHVWVDYAHKTDALEKVLKTLRKMRNGGKLITVFGCGGDRDRKKRSQMGKVAVELSDHVWITSDNPRTEEPMAIIQEILKGVVGYQNYAVDSDRHSAICHAIQSAQVGDLVLIAGKGHEDYQILGTQKVHFDDREVASEALRSRIQQNLGS